MKSMLSIQLYSVHKNLYGIVYRKSAHICQID